MNRKILFQVSAPAVVIGLVLAGACAIGVWYAGRSANDMARAYSKNVASQKATQELQTHIKDLRYHSLRYLIDSRPRSGRMQVPTLGMTAAAMAPSGVPIGSLAQTTVAARIAVRPEWLELVQRDQQRFEASLADVKRSAPADPDVEALIASIETEYQRYQDELARTRSKSFSSTQPPELSILAECHPVQGVIEPCQQLASKNDEIMETARLANERAGRWVRVAMILLGIAAGGGLLMGFGIARGLSRSIHQLRVRVNSMAQRLDQGQTTDVSKTSEVLFNLTPHGDIQDLDKQLDYVVERVGEAVESLQQHQRELLRAEQLATVGQLAASVAHEVRNPLAGMKMLVEAAMRTQNAKPLSPEDLRVIHGEIGRLEQTVQSFLYFARLPTPQRSECDLRTIISQAVELVSARARQQGVGVTVISPEAPVAANVDGNQLCTVLVNLFLNAFDAMPHGGKLRVETVLSDDEGVLVSVTDNGNGISPNVMERLFTPFVSSKPNGTGLGLSISRKIVEEHGGRLSAKNGSNQGATFILTLPPARNGKPRTNGQVKRQPRVPLAGAVSG